MTGGGESTARTLVIVRHAKAEAWATTDHQRALTGRGRRDAAVTGGWLAERGLEPDAALVSDATRTRETWAEMAGAAGWTLEPDYDPGVYSAGSDTALDLLRALDGRVSTAVLLGHNPTVGYLAQLLDDGQGDAEAVSQLLVRGFPTSAAAVFEVTDGWEALAEGSAVLRGFHARPAE